MTTTELIVIHIAAFALGWLLGECISKTKGLK